MASAYDYAKRALEQWDALANTADLSERFRYREALGELDAHNETRDELRVHQNVPEHEYAQVFDEFITIGARARRRIAILRVAAQ